MTTLSCLYKHTHTHTHTHVTSISQVQMAAHAPKPAHRWTLFGLCVRSHIVITAFELTFENWEILNRNSHSSSSWKSKYLATLVGHSHMATTSRGWDAKSPCFGCKFSWLSCSPHCTRPPFTQPTSHSIFLASGGIWGCSSCPPMSPSSVPSKSAFSLKLLKAKLLQSLDFWKSKFTFSLSILLKTPKAVFIYDDKP